MTTKREYGDRDFGGTATVVGLREPVAPQEAATKHYVDTHGGTGGNSPIALVVSVNVPRGAPLAINRATGQFVRADALIYVRALVVGFAIDATLAGFVASAQPADIITLDDWGAIAGTPLLSPGVPYFLAENGGITPTRPVAAGSSVALVGEAVSTTSLDIRRSPPILL